MQRLPKVLGREPLLEALFEVRLSGTTQIADILPGFLFHELEPKPKIERLPAADFPQPVRSADSNLQFAPVYRIDWEKYFISVGEKNVLISCKLPYPKWPDFKKTILEIVNLIAKMGIIYKVHRYSVKYVNLIEAPTLSDQLKKVKMEIILGELKVDADPINFQVHREEEDIVHIVSVINGASSKFGGDEAKAGIVVDIDSIRTINSVDFEIFSKNLDAGLEELRQKNKKKFFGCLTDETIDEMGPIYE